MGNNALNIWLSCKQVGPPEKNQWGDNSVNNKAWLSFKIKHKVLAPTLIVCLQSNPRQTVLFLHYGFVLHNQCVVIYHKMEFENQNDPLQ